MNGEFEDGRLISVECANCGREVPYAGTGRPPKYCSRGFVRATRVSAPDGVADVAAAGLSSIFSTL
ncbi:hypothetical protein [Amycolatopsis sp. FDAARGOS 1241]|uniref:hypothetical protein n=1 Tax=Amycolatopsis sp. FDAARGOS 1241 TaxID=2778070 RepID=UPI00194F99FE|nr:hypothetical protein [Amycolatopsis sp. FDAARGOS 1241]QRP43039.1 hypothetical protein I6J71_26805 [Amycolatopsis sp. FDAARGOS 1241]